MSDVSKGYAYTVENTGVNPKYIGAVLSGYAKARSEEEARSLIWEMYKMPILSVTQIYWLTRLGE